MNVESLLHQNASFQDVCCGTFDLNHLLQFRYCTWPYWNFYNNSINCSALVIKRSNVTSRNNISITMSNWYSNLPHIKYKLSLLEKYRAGKMSSLRTVQTKTEAAHTCVHKQKEQSVNFGVLLLERCRDEEGVCLGVLMLSNLNADLWDSNTDLIQEPQQSVVIDCIWMENWQFDHMSYRQPTVSLSTFTLIPHTSAGMFAKGRKLWFYSCIKRPDQAQHSPSWQNGREAVERWWL